MGRISVMSDALANQIAAGEVVERPASCVKELIENSIDAHASSIFVELLEGGISCITVQDDGDGMDAQDVVACFLRHASSKLTHPRHLNHISTLGFRGEALASIAAVARVTLSSRERGSHEGIQYTVAGSAEEMPPTVTGMPQGTRIEVRDLFFNTPARLKYLRTVNTEQARAIEVVQKAALGFPNIAFRCDVEGRTVFRSPGNGNIRDVLSSIIGAGEAGQCLKIEGSSTDYRVTGYIGRPTQGRSSRGYGYLFINGRPIRNLALHQAVVEGYRGRLMVGKHPVYAIHIDMDPSLVDVNIHPHKSEVRFSEERDLCQLLQSIVQNTLHDTFLVPSIQIPTRDQISSTQKPIQTTLQGVRYGAEPQSVSSTISPSSPRIGPALTKPVDVGRTREHYRDLSERPAPSTEVVQAVYEVAPTAVALSTSPEASRQGPERPTLQLRPIGQALGMYIVAEDGERLYIIDQHAAHERVLFEKFDERLRQREVADIPLLTPLTFRLTPQEHECAFRHGDSLRQLGVELEDFGGQDVIVRSIPDVWEGLDYAGLCESLLHGLPELQATVDIVESLRSRIVTQACKAAVKANSYLSREEMHALCDSLSELDDPFHCPHGRPVLISLSERDLEKEFRRIV